MVTGRAARQEGVSVPRPSRRRTSCSSFSKGRASTAFGGEHLPDHAPATSSPRPPARARRRRTRSSTPARRESEISRHIRQAGQRRHANIRIPENSRSRRASTGAIRPRGGIRYVGRTGQRASIISTARSELERTYARSQESQRLDQGQADPRRPRPDGEDRRGGGDHGAERLRQVDALLCHRRQAGLRGDRRRGAARRREPARARARRARRQGRLSRFPISDRDPRRRDDDLPQGRAQRAAARARREPI